MRVSQHLVVPMNIFDQNFLKFFFMLKLRKNSGKNNLYQEIGPNGNRIQACWMRIAGLLLNTELAFSGLRSDSEARMLTTVSYSRFPGFWVY